MVNIVVYLYYDSDVIFWFDWYGNGNSYIRILEEKYDTVWQELGANDHNWNGRVGLKLGHICNLFLDQFQYR